MSPPTDPSGGSSGAYAGRLVLVARCDAQALRRIPRIRNPPTPLSGPVRNSCPAVPLLPPAAPRRPGPEIASLYQPARSADEVGGDWHDVVPPADDETALVIGDVTGNGIDDTLRLSGRAGGRRGHFEEL
ncbi:hypothetical protein ACFY84_21265 [Streptomyces sp. NPDC012438]|uniref:hypothetical protein n=1 Tax=Streptomyces sp. NPDC012438 TaxID=3364833 RepID=UPI0036EB262E